MRGPLVVMCAIALAACSSAPPPATVPNGATPDTGAVTAPGVPVSPGATPGVLAPSASTPTLSPTVPPPGSTPGKGGSAGGGGAGSGGGVVGCQIFPASNPWNQDVSGLPLHPQSAAWVASVGADRNLHPDFGANWDGGPFGIPYTTVGGSQPRVPVSFEYADESDPGPYPIPPDAPIEGGADSDGDRHVLVIDTSDCVLYELYAAYPAGGGAQWTAGSGAVFDLGSNGLRPDTWTSADAAGLPIFPGLVRYDEVAAGEIRHALRFTVSDSQRAFIHPATHGASSSTDPGLPPMGARFRMRADYDCSGFSREVQVICAALKKYGMLVADNGSDWFVSGAPDSRWDDDALGDLKLIPGSAFEVVDTGPTIGY